MIGLIEQIRSVRSEMNVNPGAKLPLVLAEMSEEAQGRFDRNAPLIRRLARIDSVAVGAAEKGSVTLTMEGAVMALPLAGVVDVAAEKKRLDKAMAKVAKEVGGLNGKLSNQKFLANAPEEVIEEQRDRLAAAEAERAKLETALSRLADLG